MDMVDRLITAEDIVERTSLGRSKVYQLLADGSIPAIRIGRSVRVSESDFAAWLAEQPAACLEAVPA